MFNEKHVFFASGELNLEGLYAEGTSGSGVVISHPNPTMGGTMRNNVVDSLVQAFQEQGYGTLRFNFRGVGRSQGMFDNGRGETEDLAGAVAWLRDKGLGRIALAGYSFGAWVTAGYLKRGTEGSPCVLVAPPVSVYPFSPEEHAGKVTLVICGDRDPFCREEDMASYACRIGAKSVLIPRTDHFFVGGEEILVQEVKKILL